MVKNIALTLLLSGVAVTGLHAGDTGLHASSSFSSKTGQVGLLAGGQHDDSDNGHGDCDNQGCFNNDGTDDRKVGNSSSSKDSKDSQKTTWKTQLVNAAPLLAGLAAAGTVGLLQSRDMLPTMPQNTVVRTGAKGLLGLVSGLGVFCLSGNAGHRLSCMAGRKKDDSEKDAVVVAALAAGAYCVASYKLHVPLSAQVGFGAYALGDLVKD